MKSVKDGEIVKKMIKFNKMQPELHKTLIADVYFSKFQRGQKKKALDYLQVQSKKRVKSIVSKLDIENSDRDSIIQNLNRNNSTRSITVTTNATKTKKKIPSVL